MRELTARGCSRLPRIASRRRRSCRAPIAPRAGSRRRMSGASWRCGRSATTSGRPTTPARGSALPTAPSGATTATAGEACIFRGLSSATRSWWSRPRSPACPEPAAVGGGQRDQEPEEPATLRRRPHERVRQGAAQAGIGPRRRQVDSSLAARTEPPRPNRISGGTTTCSGVPRLHQARPGAAIAR